MAELDQVIQSRKRDLKEDEITQAFLNSDEEISGELESMGIDTNLWEMVPD